MPFIEVRTEARTEVSAAPRFVRGDANADGKREVSDGIALLSFLFFGEAGAIPCHASADLGDNGRIEVSDPILLLDHLFLGGPPPGEPTGACGPDPTEDRLSCRSFPTCR